MKVLWTDGSAKPNPGPGGFAVIEDGEPVYLGCEACTTNNRMEGLAIAAAIRYAGAEGCEIHSDSGYWINTLTKWAPRWKQNGWRRRKSTSGTTEIKNLELVKELYDLCETNRVKLVWEKGHIGTELNELADEWATRARLMEVPPEEFDKMTTRSGGIVWKGKDVR